jgi:hypothetical protein
MIRIFLAIKELKSAFLTALKLIHLLSRVGCGRKAKAGRIKKGYKE